jgi:hypothetical protein
MNALALVAVSLVCVLILAACNCAPTLRYITISPATSTIGVGTTQQYTGTGYYSNGSITPKVLASLLGQPSPPVALPSLPQKAVSPPARPPSLSSPALPITPTSRQYCSLQHRRVHGHGRYESLSHIYRQRGDPRL